MSTSVHDLSSAAEVAASLFPIVLSASGSGTTIDLGDGDGPCFAVQQIGQISDGATVAGRIEQSADASSWSTVSTFDTVDEPGTLQVIRFDRTLRYVRWAVTLTGDDLAVAAAAVIGQQKKTF
jgi:hypothetical protein